MKMIRRATALGVVLLFTSGSSFAESPELLAANSLGADRSSEADFFTDLPVVLSVSRLAQPTREAPGAVTVIDGEMIRQSGARTVAEVLRLVPGFLVAEYAQGAPLAVYHGLTSDSAGWMQVLIDGRTQYSPLWFGGVNWNVLQVSLSDIERIEVLRGSNSAAFGANAVRGVVNIVTYPAAQVQGSQVAVLAGNDGTQEIYARHGWQSGPASFRLSAEEAKTDGLDNFHDARIHHRASLRSGIQTDSNTHAEVIIGAATVKQGDGYLPETGTHPDPDKAQWLYDDPPRTRYVQSFYGQIGWTRQLGDGEELKARYFRIQEQGRMRFQARFDEFDLNTSDYGQDGLVDFVVNFDYQPSITRDDVEIQHTFAHGASRVVWGLGGRNDRVLFPAFYARDSATSERLLRAFGNWEWRLRPDLLMNLGGTYEYDSIARGAFAPRLMFNWLATAEHTWRAGVSRAHRTPSFSEQRADSKATGTYDLLAVTVTVQESLAVRTLKPEQMTAYEVGYLGEWKSRGLLLDLRAFREELRDRVLRYPTNVSALCSLPNECSDVWANAQDVDTIGIEGQLRWTPTPLTRFMLNHAVVQIAARAHGTDNADLSSSKADDANRHAERSAPNNQTSLHWVQVLPLGFESSLAYYRIPSHRWTSNTSIPAYERIDWRLGYPFRLERHKGEVALTVRAIGGGHAEYRRYPEPLPLYKSQIVYPVGYVSLRLDF